MLENVRFMFIIDDDPVQTEMIKDYLGERYIFELKTFENGETAMPDIEININEKSSFFIIFQNFKFNLQKRLY